MNDLDQALERELAELGAQTESLSARGGFTDRVMLAVAVDRAAAWPRDVLRTGRGALLGAAMVAMASVFFAFTSERAEDEVMAAEFGEAQTATYDDGLALPVDGTESESW